MRETQDQSLGQEDSLEKGMATHSSILALRTPGAEKPGRLYSPWRLKESDMAEGPTHTHTHRQTQDPHMTPGKAVSLSFHRPGN